MCVGTSLALASRMRVRRSSPYFSLSSRSSFLRMFMSLVLAVLDEDGERLLEREGLRCAVDQAQHVDAERHLQVGLVEQGVQNRVGLGIALNLDHNTHTVAVALVAHGRDAVDLALTHEVG